MYLFTGMVFLGAGIVTYGIELPFMNIYTSKGYYAFFFGLILGRFLYNREITAKMAVVMMLFAVSMFGVGRVSHYLLDLPLRKKLDMKFEKKV